MGEPSWRIEDPCKGVAHSRSWRTALVAFAALGSCSAGEGQQGGQTLMSKVGGLAALLLSRWHRGCGLF